MEIGRSGLMLIYRKDFIILMCVGGRGREGLYFAQIWFLD